MQSFKFNVALVALFHYHLGFDMHLEAVVGLAASFRIWHAFRSSVGVHNYILAMLVVMWVLYPLDLVFFFVRCIFLFVFGIRSCWSSKNNSVQRLLSTLFVRSFFVVMCHWATFYSDIAALYLYLIASGAPLYYISELFLANCYCISKNIVILHSSFIHCLHISWLDG